MNKRNILYITITVICVISIILGVYYQIFEGKVVNEADLNEIENVIVEDEVDDPQDLLAEFNKLFKSTRRFRKKKCEFLKLWT